jgi:hypothetical protein
MPDPVSGTGQARSGIQPCSGFPLEFTPAKAGAGMTVLAFMVAGVITIGQVAKASSGISIIERSSLLIALAAASTSGRTCLMKYRAEATFPS